MDPGNPCCDPTLGTRPDSIKDLKLPAGPNTETNELAQHVLNALHHLVTGKTPALAPGSLSGYAGVALIQTTKAALLVGHEIGSGIIVKVIGTEADGSPKLSAPVPIKSSKTGVGLSLGFDKVYSAVLLKTEQDVLAFAKGEVAVAGSTVESLSHKETLHYLDPTKSSSGLQVVSVADSHMVVDFSPYGGTLGLDEDMVVFIYGARITVNDLLVGNVKAPKVFEPIYDILKQDFTAKKVEP